MQHPCQRRAREADRVDRERAPEARRLQARVHRLGPEERLWHLAELGVGKRDPSVERTPADHLGHHFELRQIERVAEQTMLCRGYCRVDRPERRDGSRRKHRRNRVIGDLRVALGRALDQLAQVRGVPSRDLALQLQMAESVRQQQDNGGDAARELRGQDGRV